MTLIGAVLAGKYRVERVLGQGGMGIVVQAHHLQLMQPVAMKFLLPEVLGNPQVVQRFLREAQAAVRLKSEHVARVIDVGTMETGAPYMVLEYLDGTDLAHFPRGQLGVGLVVDLMLQACEALAEAHALDIVHRDIKPANFFVTRRADGSLLLKILDFGISKAPSTDSNLTGTQMVMGTPAYMSPEQMKSSRSVDGRTDIWSLGIVLYELLQGGTPFQADTFSSMIIKVATESLPPMSVRLPGRLAEIVYRCLEKDVTRRFQSVAEVAQALAPYAQSATQAAISVERTSRVIGAVPPTNPPHQVYPPSTLTVAAASVSTQASSRRVWPFIAGGTAAIGIIVVIAIALANGGHDAEPAKQPTVGAPAVAAPTPVAPAPPPAPAAPPPSQPVAAPSTTPPPAATPPPATPAVATPVPDEPAPTPPHTPKTHTPKQPAKPTTANTGSKPAATKPAAETGGSDDILGTRN